MSTQRPQYGIRSITDPAAGISWFEEAKRLAKRRGWSRSELYANAVAKYVKGERFFGVRERLDAVYGADPDISDLDPVIEQAQAHSLLKKKW